MLTKTTEMTYFCHRIYTGRSNEQRHRVSSDQPRAHSEAGSMPYRLLPPSGGTGQGVHLEGAKVSLCRTRV